MTTAYDLHVGDIGTILRITIKEGAVAKDISTATVTEFHIKKKDGSMLTVPATWYTDGTDGKLQYVFVDGDVTVAGKWYAQPYLELPNWSGHTARVEFMVGTPIG